MLKTGITALKLQWCQQQGYGGAVPFVLDLHRKLQLLLFGALPQGVQVYPKASNTAGAEVNSSVWTT